MNRLNLCIALALTILAASFSANAQGLLKRELPDFMKEGKPSQYNQQPRGPSLKELCDRDPSCTGKGARENAPNPDNGKHNIKRRQAKP